MSGKRFKEKEKEKVDLKVVSPEAPASYALAPIEKAAEEEVVELLDSLGKAAEPEKSAESEKAETSSKESQVEAQFEKLELIGSGAMGEVWKVRERSTGKIFANKYIIPELASNETALKRFEQEAKVAVDLHHPNLAAVYGPGVDETGQPFIQIHYVEGENLAQVLAREGKLSPERAQDIFDQICEGLKYLHAHGIVHRDIKPSNILIGKTDSGADLVYITDFGISKSIYEDVQPTHALTQTADVLGSWLYASPEQCLGETLTIQSDIYSLGCVYYEMLTGDPPFNEKNSVKVIVRQLGETPKFDSIPDNFRLLITLCLYKNINSRPKSVENLLEIHRSLSSVTSTVSRLGSSSFPFMITIPTYCLAIASCCFHAATDPKMAFWALYSQSCLMSFSWYALAGINRSNSLKVPTYRRLEISLAVLFFVSLTCSVIVMLNQWFTVPLILVGAMLVFALTLKIESMNSYDRCIDSFSRLAHNADFAKLTSGIVAPFSWLMCTILCFDSATELLKGLLNQLFVGDLAPQTIFTSFLISVGSFCFALSVMWIFRSEKRSNILVPLRKCSLLLGCWLVVFLVVTTSLWTPSSDFIIKQSLTLYNSSELAKQVPAQANILPQDTLGNFARILAVTKMVDQEFGTQKVLDYSNEVIQSETKPSLNKAAAYAYKAVATAREKGWDNAVLDFNDCLTTFAQMKKPSDLDMMRIKFLDEINYDRYKDVAGNALYFLLKEAYFADDYKAAKKILDLKDKLKISDGDNSFTYYREKVEKELALLKMKDEPLLDVHSK